MPLALPTLPLRRWILWPLALAFLLAGALITLFAQGEAHNVARELGRGYAAEIGERIEAPLAAELLALERRVRLNAEALAGGSLHVDEPLANASTLHDRLRYAENLTFLSIAWPDGRYLGAARLPQAKSEVSIAANFIERPLEMIGYAIGPDGRLAGHYGEEAPKFYDPRQREFFQRAAAAPGPVWGQVESYVGWPVFGIGVSAPVRDARGTLLAVTGGAITLERLAGVLSSLRLPAGGLVVVSDQNGDLIATSDGVALVSGKPGDVQRVALTDHPHPATDLLATLLDSAANPRPRVLVVDDAAYLYDLRPLSAPTQLGWSIAVILPESAFTEPLRLGQLRLIALVALVLVVVGGLGLALSRAVVGPVERLGDAAVRGELDELARRDATSSPVLEVARLSQALGNLAEALKSSISSLEQRVAERTAELEDANAQLSSLSLRDPLTGLGNRRALETALQHECDDARQRREPLALLLLDIDRFKQLNDHFGHLAGDEALRQVAARIALQVADTRSFLARYGGEEFLLLLPGHGAADARAKAEAIRQAVADATFHGLGSATAGVPITLSVGLAILDPGAPESPEALIARADDGLYRAKSGGRNRVELATAADPIQPA